LRILICGHTGKLEKLRLGYNYFRWPPVRQSYSGWAVRKAGGRAELWENVFASVIRRSD